MAIEGNALEGEKRTLCKEFELSNVPEIRLEITRTPSTLAEKLGCPFKLSKVADNDEAGRLKLDIVAG